MKVVVIVMQSGVSETARASQDLGIDVTENGDLLIIDPKGRPSGAIAAGQWARAVVEDDK